MRILFSSIMLMVGLLPGCAGHLNVTEKMMWSTYPLLTPKGTATSFVVNRPDGAAAGGVTPVVFTSRHVLETVGKGPLVLALRMKDSSGIVQVAMLAMIPPPKRGKEKFYVSHPTHDLAAFALHLPAGNDPFLKLGSAMNESNLKRRGNALRAGDEVEFLGYPEVLPGTEGGFAVLRSGRVASYPVGTSQSRGIFLINSDVYGGDSGAPVFMPARLGSRPILVGAISERFSTTDGKFSHLALAVDADVIRETMALLSDREIRLSATPVPSGNRSSIKNPKPSLNYDLKIRH